jgi:hypothetical protein
MTSNVLAILHCHVHVVHVVFSLEEINYGEWTIDFLQKRKKQQQSMGQVK